MTETLQALGGSRSPSACRGSTRWRSGRRCARARSPPTATEPSSVPVPPPTGMRAAPAGRHRMPPSTGPGALNSLTAMMEAASSHVPVARDLQPDPVGAARPKGAVICTSCPISSPSFAPLVKHAERVDTAQVIPEVLARAWAIALMPPSGPVYVEIPVDLLTAEAGAGAAADAPAEPLPAPARRLGDRDGGGRAARGPAPCDLGGWRRDPIGRAGRAPQAGRAARCAGRHDLHGQRGATGRASPGGGVRLRRGRLPGAAPAPPTSSSASAPSSAPRRPRSTRCSSMDA